MSREIKFRDYELVENVMRYFTLDTYDRYEHDCFGNIMQFTGLKDKNGIEIYEGDILDTKCVVSFNDGMFGIFDKHNYMGLNSYMSKFREVIGNIYENPELLQL
jgi:uncharacterized phage protein (TIGR01671 family)